jgi:predicted transcriptional regulator
MGTNVLVVDANRPVSEAAMMMRDANVGFLPVCYESSGEILGTITDRDIAIRLVADEMSPRIIAGELATPETIFCRISADVEQALELMRENRVARLLCVDESGRLAGILSLSDIAAKMPELATETLRELSRHDQNQLHKNASSVNTERSQPKTTTPRSGPRRKDSRKPAGRKQTSIGEKWMRDFLSEMLAVESGGVKLYEKTLNELEHLELRDSLTEFLHQTQFHVEVCTEMLAAAGASADYRSPGAEAADHKALRLISTEVPIDLRDLNNLENLVLAETKDQWNWEMLASVEKKIGDPQLKSIVSRAVREVRKQETSHLNWNEHALTSLAMKAAMKTEPAVTDASVRASHGQD